MPDNCIWLLPYSLFDLFKVISYFVLSIDKTTLVYLIVRMITVFDFNKLWLFDWINWWIMMIYLWLITDCFFIPCFWWSLFNIFHIFRFISNPLQDLLACGYATSTSNKRYYYSLAFWLTATKEINLRNKIW